MFTETVQGVTFKECDVLFFDNEKQEFILSYTYDMDSDKPYVRNAKETNDFILHEMGITVSDVQQLFSLINCFSDSITVYYQEH